MEGDFRVTCFKLMTLLTGGERHWNITENFRDMKPGTSRTQV